VNIILFFLVIIAIVGVVYICFLFVTYQCIKGILPVTDLFRYQEIRNSYLKSSLLTHFPEQIPTDATNVSFYFKPAFLQGDNIIQLQMKLPPEKIKTLQAQFRQAAKRKYIPGNPNNSPIEETSYEGINIYFSYNFYNTDKKERNIFDLTYEILVLEDDRGKPTYEWNRPTYYGVAIDISKAEIIYFAVGR